MYNAEKCLCVQEVTSERMMFTLHLEIMGKKHL